MKEGRIQPWDYEQQIQHSLVRNSNLSDNLHFHSRLLITPTKNKSIASSNSKNSVTSTNNHKINFIKRNIMTSNSFYRQIFAKQWTHEQQMSQFNPNSNKNQLYNNPESKRAAIKTTYIGYLDEQPHITSYNTRSITMKQLLARHKKLKSKIYNQQRSFTNKKPQSNANQIYAINHFQKLLKIKDKLRSKVKTPSKLYHINIQQIQENKYKSIPILENKNEEVIKVQIEKPIDKWKVILSVKKSQQKFSIKKRQNDIGIIGSKMHY